MARPVTPLKLAIVASGCTQRTVANAAGTDEYRLSRIVNGREVPPSDLQLAIAVALGRDVEDLWPGHGDASDHTTSESNSSRLENAA